MRIVLGTILVLTLLLQQGYSQCTLEGPFPVNDFDVLELELEISGLQNNDLGSSGQGVCGIAINFEHERVSNLLVEVESPSGQVVTLIGPPGPFGLTYFTQWDISFVPCGSAAAPDQNFSAFWTNQNNWGNFGDYTGSYYPFSGCLEDLNTGSANGTWTFTIRDQIQFDEGEIESITLFFCDPTGADCEYCNPGDITFQESSLDICEDSLPAEIPDFDWTGIFDSASSNYSFIIAREDTIVQIPDTLQVPVLQEGVYEICGLTYETVDSAAIFNLLDSGLLIGQLVDSITANGLCARVSEHCLTLNVGATSDTIRVDTFFCSGDTLPLYGRNVYEADTFIYVDSAQICPMIFEVSVSELNLNAQIQDLDTLNCEKDSLFINAQGSGLRPDTEILWYKTGEGLIASDTLGIWALDTGSYTLILRNGDCTDSLNFRVLGDFTLPYFYLNSFDTLNCENNVIKIYPDSTNAESWTWVTPAKDTINSDSLNAGMKGTYQFIAKGGNGCASIDSFEVVREGNGNLSEIDTTVNLCGADTIFLQPFEVNNDLIYTWSGPGGFTASKADTFAFTDGNYQLLISDSSGNCSILDSFNYQLSPSLDTPAITSDSLGCFLAEVEIILDSVLADYNYRWISPDMDTLFQPEPSVSQEGQYKLIISKGENCYIELHHSVIRSEDIPDFSIVGDSLTCVDSFTILTIMPIPSDSMYSVEWQGPLGSRTEGDSLRADLPGTYTVFIRTGQSCERIDSFELLESFSTYDHQLSVDTLNCIDTIVDLFISGPDSFLYVWRGPSGLVDTGQQLNTLISGYYTVSVNDGSCVYQRGVEVISDEAPPEIIFDAAPINCLNDTARIYFNAEKSFDTYLYDTDSSGYVQLSQPRFQTAQTGMISFRFIGENGCSFDTTFQISADTLIPDYQINLSDTLNCNNPEIQVSLISMAGVNTVSWLQGLDTISMDTVAQIESAEQLALRAVFDNGCSVDTMVQVPFDTLSPSVDFELLALTCNRSFYWIDLEPSNRIDSLFIQSPTEVYSVDTSSFVIDQGGSYNLKVLGDNGCITDTTFFVDVDTSIQPIIFFNDTIRCGQNTTQILTSSDTQFVLNAFWVLQEGDSLPGISTELPEGTHVLHVLGENGCRATFEKAITKDSYQAEVSGLPDSIILTCRTQEVFLEAQINAAYDSVYWYRDAQVIQDSLPIRLSSGGRYDLEIYKRNCKDTVSTEVILDTVPPDLEILGNSLGCRNPSTTLSVNSNRVLTDVQWRGPNGFTDSIESPVIIDTGMYHVEITDQRGCKNVDSIFITGDFEKPDYSLPDTFYQNCLTGLSQIYVQTDRSNSVNWYANTQRLSTLDSFATQVEGKIILVIEGENGCRVSDSSWIEGQGLEPKAQWETPILDCNNITDTIRLIRSEGDLVFNWAGPRNYSSNSASPVIDTGGAYVVRIENEYNCTHTDTLIITQASTVIRPNIEISDPIRCQDSTTQLILSFNRELRDTIVSWRVLEGQILDQNDPMRLFVSGPGRFEFEVRDPEDNCSTKDTFELNWSSPVDFPVDTLVKQLLCEEDSGGEVILLTEDASRAPYQYRMDNNMTVVDSVFSGLPAGLFRFTVFDRQLCEQELIVEIDEDFSKEIVDLGPDREAEAGDEINIRPDWFIDTAFIDSIIWRVNGTQNCLDCESISVFLESSKLIEIQAYTIGGCISTDTLIIEVPTDDVLFIPNVFSPNEDGNNDFFFIQTALEIEEIELLEIYGRGGNRVFQVQNFPPNDLSYGWDGKFEGQALTPQVFAIRIIYTYEGERKVEHHSLTLIR